MSKGPATAEEERLAITTTGYGKEQLVGVPVIANGTGKEIASNVAEELRKKQIENDIKAICYDTTASNSGAHNGAVVLLEQNLKRKLLHFPCRHHIMKLLLEAAFSNAFEEKSCGPDISIFKRFQKAWTNIDKGIQQLKLCF